ncbi:MAG: hypothetical protein APF82_00315 [Sphingomonadales bacterium BRH_c42]|nr:MAG: hypothetical protein APF82_00315 [Sphingomonadales bacterium BRH_c42]
MKNLALIAGIASLVAVGSAASATATTLYEEAYAREQEKLIITAPIAGIQNRLWFDYRIDVMEAQKELSSDLRGASDLEDRRDAWEEYGHELSKERKRYIEGMAKRGYRMGTVTVDTQS